MINVKVLGGGCAKCQATYKLFNRIIAEKGMAAMLEKVEDIQEIMAHDVMSTPGVVINGIVVHQGSVPSSELVESWLVEP
ncbi:MAG: thioredoxin family protein [Candidatus Marinimicrobia bacterium]|nr:thioredoxin family protein [Candidatus Neomarinimicrobiota bacterium]